MATIHRRLVFGLLGFLLCAGPIRQAFAQELLQSGGFEEGVAPWQGCGGVAVVGLEEAGTTPAMVRSGGWAARVGGLSDGTCNSFLSSFVLVQPVVIPADATAVTLTFWFSRLGPDLPPDGNTVADMSVSLSTDPLFTTALFDVVSHNVLRGWTPFRGTLPSADLAQFRGQTAYLRFAVPYTGDYDVAYFIDDVSLVVGDVHTQAEPTPAALAGDGTRPLVLLQRNPANPDGLTVVRLDSDGTNPLAIDTGLLHAPRVPRWSPDGSTITVLDDDVSPHDIAVPASLKARITRLSVMRADGSNRQEIFSTQGLQGTTGTPPFCRPPNCVDLPRAALDQTIRGVDWSPDGRAVAATICARSRYHWGESDDDLCHVEILDAGNGAVIRKDLDGWFLPDWGATGRMLFNGAAQYPDYTLRGVWEGEPSVTPATQSLIVPAPTDLLIGGDRLPTWAPDGRRFVTARQIGGNRWDANGFAVTNEAVVLHDREDLENPRVLLIADHGGISGAVQDFTWSPDGRWVLYTLYESTDSANIWWLDVETGATGRVTNDGASVSVDWRKRDDGGPGPGPAPANACGAETPGAARAACYLAAIASAAKAMPAATRGARRSSKRIAQRALAARKAVLQLAKKSTTRRVAKARKATLAVAAAIERARTKGDIAPGSADGLAAIATAATAEIGGL